MVNRLCMCGVAIAASLLADTLVLRSGRTVEGDYVGGSPRTVRMQIGDRTETFDVNIVSEIRFGAAASGSAAVSTPQPAVLTPRSSETPVLATRPPAPASAATPASSKGTIPAGTALVVRMIDDVDSERASVGQTFKASVDETVSVDGVVTIERGADVILKLIDDKESGKLTGRTELTLDVVSVQINGRMVDVLAEGVTQASESRTGKTGKVVGGTAALGAIIGAIAGGGKGAAIGAVSGAAAGGAVQVMTKGQKVRIPSETRLTFTLQQPLRT